MKSRQLTVKKAKIYETHDNTWIQFKPYVTNDRGDEDRDLYHAELNDEGCIYAPYKLHINLPLNNIPYPQIVLIAHNVKKYLLDKIKEGVIPTFKHLNGLQNYYQVSEGIETAFNNWINNPILSALINNVSNQRFIHFAQFTISLFNDTSPEYCDALHALIVDINRIIAFCSYPVINNSNLTQSCDSHLYGHVSFRKDYFLSGSGEYYYIPTDQYYLEKDQTVLSESPSVVKCLTEQNEESVLTRLRDTNWPSDAEINLKEVKDTEFFLQTKFLPLLKPICEYTPLQLKLIRELDCFKIEERGLLSRSDKVIFEAVRKYLTKQVKKEDEEKGEEEKDNRKYAMPSTKLQKILLDNEFASLIPPDLLETVKMLNRRAEFIAELNTYILSREKETKSDKLFGNLKKMTQDVKIRAAKKLFSYLSNLDKPFFNCIFEKEDVDALIEGTLGKIIGKEKYQFFLPKEIEIAQQKQKQGILSGFRTGKST
jgi:hypothetical protein